MRARHLNLMLDDDLNKRVRADARQRKTTVSAVVREALRAYYDVAATTDDAAEKKALVAAVGRVRRRVEAALADLTPELEP